MGAPEKDEDGSDPSVCWWSFVEQDQVRTYVSFLAHQTDPKHKCDARSMVTAYAEGEKRD